MAGLRPDWCRDSAQQGSAQTATIVHLDCVKPAPPARGRAGNDTLEGTPRANVIFGGDGDDLIEGGSSNDKLHGDAGNDTIGGGTGHDRVYGDDGNDEPAGHSGNDRLYGDIGLDTFTGGGSNDFFHSDDDLAESLFDASGNDTADADDGMDEIVLRLSDLRNHHRRPSRQ